LVFPTCNLMHELSMAYNVPKYLRWAELRVFEWPFWNNRCWLECVRCFY
jgi:hypothetical protein